MTARCTAGWGEVHTGSLKQDVQHLRLLSHLCFGCLSPTPGSRASSGCSSDWGAATHFHWTQLP